MKRAMKTLAAFAATLAVAPIAALSLPFMVAFSVWHNAKGGVE